VGDAEDAVGIANGSAVRDLQRADGIEENRRLFAERDMSRIAGSQMRN